MTVAIPTDSNHASGIASDQQSGAKSPPLLIRQGEVFSVKEAAIRADVDDKTIRRWCNRYPISRKRTGARNAPIEISMLALEMLLANDQDALAIFQAGNDRHPQVMVYRDFLGLRTF